MAYNPPGVSVTEYTNPVVSPLLATADTLCLVGPTPGGIQKTDVVQFSTSELLNSSGWTSTGWTVVTGIDNKYTHTTGNTTALTNSFVPSGATFYQITITVSGLTAGNLAIGSSSAGISFNSVGVNTEAISSNGTYTYNVRTASGTPSTGLKIVPSSDFDGTITASVLSTTNKFQLPSIPKGGVLRTIDSVRLAEGAPSGRASGIHYEPFTATVALNTSDNYFTAPSSSSTPWGVYQTITAQNSYDYFSFALATSSGVTAGSPASGSVKYKTTSAHNLSVGDTVTISGITGSGTTGYNGTFIVDTIVSSTEFSVVNATTGGTITTTSAIVTPVVNITKVESTTAGTKVTLSRTPTTASSTAQLNVNGTTAAPAHYSTVSTTPVYANLASDITIGATSVTLDSVTNWPTTGGYFKIDNEVFVYTSITGNILNGVTGAQNGTVAAAHASGTEVALFTNTIARTSTSSICSGDSVYVTYTYTPSDYFNVIQLDTMSDVVDRFGPVYKNDGTIDCPLSFAAQIAFENGVNSVLLQPLFVKNATGTTRQQPTNVGDTAAWDDTFNALKSTANINIIVPIIGTGMTFPSSSPGAAATLGNAKSVHDRLKTHVITMINEEDQYIVGIVGHDGSNTASGLSSIDMISYANQIRLNHQGQDFDQQMVFVSVTKLQRPVSVARTSVALNIGGQYAAVAIGSMSASRQVSTSLTRKNVSGFSAVLDARTKKEKNTEAAAGMCVLEQVNGFVQVRHALTMDNTSGVSRSELSVVRAKYFMMASLKNTVDTQLIGNVVADGNAPLVISTTIASTLETLKNNGDLVDYSDVQARTLSVDPTTIDVRFSYRPAFPVNYINIGFSIDLTTGNSTLTQANTLQAG